MLSIGAKGVQMGSRFVATHECDANDKFKEAYINASNDDICLIDSPVGLPGRAILNPFLEETKKGKVPVKKCFDCLTHCNPAQTPYCISQALINSVKGEDGLVFSGARAGEIKKITSVKDLIENLKSELINY